MRATHHLDVCNLLSHILQQEYNRVSHIFARDFKKEGTRFDEAMDSRVVARAQYKLGHAGVAIQAYERAAGELTLIGNAEMARRAMSEAQKMPGDVV